MYSFEYTMKVFFGYWLYYYIIDDRRKISDKDMLELLLQKVYNMAD